MSAISVEFQQLTRLAVVISPTISTLSQLSNQGGGGRAVEGLMSVARSATMASTALKSLNDVARSATSALNSLKSANDNADKDPCPCPPPCPCECKDAPVGNVAPAAPGAPAAPAENAVAGKITDMLGKLANSVWELTKTKQQQEITMNMAFGKAEGSGMLKELEKMQSIAPLPVDALMPQAIALKNFGMATKEIIPMLYMLGDVSGGNAEKFKTLSETFAKIQESGKLSADTFGTLKTAGLDPLELISKQSGISVATLQKRLNEGRITVDMVRDAFQVATSEGGKFTGILDDQANTIDGKWNIITAKMQNMLSSMGDIVGPVAGVILDFINGLADGEPGVWLMTTAVASLALAMNAGGIGAGVMAVGMSIGATATTILRGAMAVLNFVMNMNPIAKIVWLITLLGGAFITLYQKVEGFRAFIDGMGAGIKSFGKLIKDYLIDSFMIAVDAIKGASKVLELIFKGDWKGAMDAAGETFAKVEAGINKQLVHTVQNANATVDAYNTANKASRENFQREEELAKIQKNAQRNSGTQVTPDYGTLKNDLPEEPKNRAENINNNGPRSIVINIGKQIEKLEVHALSAKEGVEEMGNLVREEMRRVLLSLNAMPVN
ncbi:tape measure protein [Chitinophaga sp. Hz27]|uniref:tape measure protein n=1 Tax=Chitinophaga sp. Hz27 TaxID=3347169 RepID=UPI0035DF35EC